MTQKELNEIIEIENMNKEKLEDRLLTAVKEFSNNNNEMTVREFYYILKRVIKLFNYNKLDKELNTTLIRERSD